MLVYSAILAATCPRRIVAVERTFGKSRDWSVEVRGRTRGIVLQNVLEEVDRSIEIAGRRRDEFGGQLVGDVISIQS